MHTLFTEATQKKLTRYFLTLMAGAVLLSGLASAGGRAAASPAATSPVNAALAAERATSSMYLPVVSTGKGRLPGQVMVDPGSPSWLVYNRDSDNNGRLDPFFLAGPGDPEDFLFRGTRQADGTRSGDQMALINKLAGTGANSIYFQAIRSHGGDGDPSHNPFVDSNPNKGLDSDILDQWETWFTAMDNAGIVIYFFLYDDSACIWGCSKGNSANANTPAEERAYLEALVNRFEHHRHLIWVIAEEYAEKFTPQRAASMASVIRAADDYEHVIALHQNDGLVFDLALDPHVDQFAVQYNGPSGNGASSAQMHSSMLTAWQNAAGRYNINMSESAEHGTGTVARHKNWAAAMAGSYVMILGMDIANTAVADLQDLGRMRAFFEAADFNRMVPRDDLAFGGSQYVLAQPGSSYIAYAANLSGSIGLKNMSAGTYDFTWLDTRTGTAVTQAGIAVGGGSQTWPTPGGIGGEVAVYIRRSN